MNKIALGFSVHNAFDHAEKSITLAMESCKRAGLEVDLLITDDNSELDDARCRFMEFLEDKAFPSAVGYRFVRRETNPNLGRNLNAHLNLVDSEHAYYLNVETDVFLREDTVLVLMDALAETNAPCATPVQFDTLGRLDLHYYGQDKRHPDHPWAKQWLTNPLRPKWVNLGCLLIPGFIARDRLVRSDEQHFTLWCVDTDYTSALGERYGRPVITPHTHVVHVGQQSTKEHEEGGYGHLAAAACKLVDTKWAHYLAGGLF